MGQALAWTVFLALLLGGCERVETFIRGGRCVLSGREVHAGMAVRVMVEGSGKSGDACCLRCALSYAIQTQRTIRILSVTDFATGRRVRPRDAFYVVGSDVRPCSAPLTDTAANRSECLLLSWDRCNPSTVAFASAAEAKRFRNEHGGRVETFQQIVRSAPKATIQSD